MSQPVILKKLELNKFFYEDLQDLLELTPKTYVLFIIGNWNAKVGSQEKPGVTCKFGLGFQNEAGQRLTEFCQEKALVITNTLFQQHMRRLYTWTSPDGQYQNRTVYILCRWRWRNSIQSAKIRLGADCGSDHELLIAKFRHNSSLVIYLSWVSLGSSDILRSLSASSRLLNLFLYNFL